MSDSGETFFTSVGCMDGRALRPVQKYGKHKFGVWYVDTITEAGLVGKLSSENIDQDLINSIKFKIVDVSIGKHHSKGIIVHGHQDCAGNPVPDEKHKEDILKTAEIIKSFVPENIPVIPIFVVKNKDWEALELTA